MIVQFQELQQDPTNFTTVIFALCGCWTFHTSSIIDIIIEIHAIVSRLNRFASFLSDSVACYNELSNPSLESRRMRDRGARDQFQSVLPVLASVIRYQGTTATRGVLDQQECNDSLYNYRAEGALRVSAVSC